MHPVLHRERGERAETAYYHFEDGYHYHRDKTIDRPDGTTTVYLRCTHRDTIRACRGTCAVVEVEGQVYLRRGKPHTCLPNPMLAADRNARHRVLDQIRANRNVLPTDVLRNVRLE